MLQLIIAFVLAIISGMNFPEIALFAKAIADLVLRPIIMIIVPLVVFSISSSITGLKNPGQAERLFSYSFLIFIFTTIAATFIADVVAGIAFSHISVPDLSALSQGDATKILENSSKYGGFLDALFRIVPDNMLQALVNGDPLLAVLVGAGLGLGTQALSRSENKDLQGLGEFGTNGIAYLAELINMLIGKIVKAMPFAVYGFTTHMVATQDPEMFWALAKMIGIGYATLILHVVITYGGLLYFVANVNPITFVKKFFRVQIFAYGSASSAATIPLNERTLTEKLGVSKETASFTIPFGATVNMDGTAVAQVVYCVFLAHLTGIPLGLTEYIMIAVMSSVVSIGVAAVPSASMVTLGVVLGTVGINPAGIAYILPVDRLLDMMRTAVNVTGDATVSLVMDKIERRFNKEKFNA